ncbi:GDSL-type esterase/lipase family protein [Sulfurovum sp. zt1-1]|uniref:GDSL-type esterase/lipase family protein n=1 Tax=Sulfurovum zhangzhouensis TaxID=3019067 RepID=A0ABT7QUW7_9BACT|nr:GDSL-type esterase/lipase family protein [Sulfurovum zhangzhouensis]MDM5270577.1 GDSL-type esterase/lipase family protein [Sulfurovum zhangzhouensis]
MKIRYIVLILSIVSSALFIACGGGGGTISDSENKIRVACIGDSITYGANLPSTQSYPSQLSTLLGEEWAVENFGVSGTTALKDTSQSYWNSSKFISSHDYNPDIVVIMFGTNDLKPSNWVYKDQFISDYTDLIESYKTLSSQPAVYICYPPPVYNDAQGYPSENIPLELIPMIDDIASINNVPIIDNYSILYDKEYLFPDDVHPNAEGAQMIAEEVYSHIY